MLDLPAHKIEVENRKMFLDHTTLAQRPHTRVRWE